MGSSSSSQRVVFENDDSGVVQVKIILHFVMYKISKKVIFAVCIL